MIFENKTPLLIIIELDHLCRKDLPLSLRLLIDTRTFLEWNILHQRPFWRQLRQLLGTPLSKTELDPLMSEENLHDPITWPTRDEIQRIIDENLASCDEECFEVNDTTPIVINT